MLKVGLDIQVLQCHERSGFGYYVDGLYRSLVELASNLKQDVEIIGLESQWTESLPTVKRWWHDRFELASVASQQGVDSIHQPCFSAPKSGKKVIWTLHDLRSIILREQMSIPASLYWKKWLPYSARYADQIVATSENTKKDGIKYLGLDPDSIKVITIGLPKALEAWKPHGGILDEARLKFGVTGPFFSSLGTIQPIKNYPFLIDVFVALRQEFKLNHQLVIIGGKGWDYPNVRAKLAEHDLKEGKEVVITGYVTDDEKWNLISASDTFLFPSLYEGFGIPPLEAQAVGVPVISADNSSLPWVVGDGAVLASARDVKTWISGYEMLTKDRSTLIKNGLTNVNRFDWNAIALEWIKLYTSLG